MNRNDKTVFGALLVCLFSAVTGVGIVVPLLPVYAHDLGASGIYIGLIFSAFSFSKALLLPYFGRLSDQKGRKPLIIAGLSGYALISLGLIASRNVETLIILRFVQGMASAMMMPVIQAYAGDITPAGKEGLIMGLFNLAAFCGLSMGPLLGGIVNDRFGLGTAFACMGALAGIGALFGMWALPTRRAERATWAKKPIVSFRKLVRDRYMTGLLLVRFAYAAGIGIIWSFMPVFASAELKLSGSSIGFLVMLGIFISGILNVPMGLLADRIDRKLMVVCGCVIAGIGIVSYEWAQGFADLFLANALFGIGGGIAMPALMALCVATGSRTDSMGSTMGLMNLAHSLGMLAGAMAGGIAMDVFELRRAFSFGALMMILAPVIFLIYSSRKAAVPVDKTDKAFLEPLE